MNSNFSEQRNLLRYFFARCSENLKEIKVLKNRLSRKKIQFIQSIQLKLLRHIQNLSNPQTIQPQRKLIVEFTT